MKYTRVFGGLTAAMVLMLVMVFVPTTVKASDDCNDLLNAVVARAQAVELWADLVGNDVRLYNEDIANGESGRYAADQQRIDQDMASLATAQSNYNSAADAAHQAQCM